MIKNKNIIKPLWLYYDMKKKVTKKKTSKNNFFKMTERKNLDERILTNFFDKKKYRAILYNDNGEQIATINLDRSKNTFEFKDGTYNIKWDNNTFFFRSNVFNKFKYFFYIVGNPDPLSYDKDNNNYETKFSAKQYNIMLKTNIAQKLNNVGKGLGELLTPKNLLIGGIVIAVGYYFLSGGTLT